MYCGGVGGHVEWVCAAGGSEFPLIVESRAKRERESAAGWEVLGSAPIVGVSASTFSSSWVPTVGMATLPSLWPLDRGPLLSCFHHPFLIYPFLLLLAPSSFFVFWKWLHNIQNRDVSELICQSNGIGLWSDNQWDALGALFFKYRATYHSTWSKQKKYSLFLMFKKHYRWDFLINLFQIQISESCVQQKKRFVLWSHVSGNGGFLCETL